MSSSEQARPNPNPQSAGGQRRRSRFRHEKRRSFEPPVGVHTSSRNNKRQKKNRPAGPIRRETSAGGIIFRVKSGIVEIFFIHDSYSRWTFPKGHQELGETLAETAIREIQEETGMQGLKYEAPLGKTSFRFRREGVAIYKSVHYFLFEAPANAEPTFRTREQVGEGRELIQEGRWVPMRQAFSVSSYKNSDHLLANAFRIIGARHEVPIVPAGGRRHHPKNRRR